MFPCAKGKGPGFCLHMDQLVRDLTHQVSNCASNPPVTLFIEKVCLWPKSNTVIQEYSNTVLHEALTMRKAIKSTSYQPFNQLITVEQYLQKTGRYKSVLGSLRNKVEEII